LAQSVRFGGADFRIKPDGSAIEPVTGTTHTFGHAFTEDGERFTTTTSVPDLFVTPLPWRYLARNPDAAAPRTEQSAADDQVLARVAVRAEGGACTVFAAAGHVALNTLLAGSDPEVSRLAFSLPGLVPGQRSGAKARPFSPRPHARPQT
jgi:hypothetical protein